MRGNLYIISGPAGTGKTEIVKTLLRQHPEIGLSISCTTREPRKGETDGVDYFYVSEERFGEIIKEDGFYEWAAVHGHHYGTPKSYVEQELTKGRDMILEIDVQGCLNVLKLDPDATGIFICPPSGPILEARLRGRNSESEESLAIRLGNAAGEVKIAHQYDYIIVNRDWNEYPNALQTAVDEIWSIMVAKRHETKHWVPFLDELESTLRH